MFPAFILFCLLYVVGTNDVKEENVVVGNSHILHTEKEGLKGNILWRGPHGYILNVTRHYGAPSFNYYDNDLRDRFKISEVNRGCLEISNIRMTDSGLYEMENQDGNVQFNVNIYARISNPVITRDSSQCSSSSGSCSLLCSVVNVSHVTFSWFKGNSLLSSISVSDLISSVSLHLEVKDQENKYRCEIRNPAINHTTHLDINQLCHTCPRRCCGFTEAVISLVFAAVVGVATVAIVVYEITSGRAELKPK